MSDDPLARLIAAFSKYPVRTDTTAMTTSEEDKWAKKIFTRKDRFHLSPENVDEFLLNWSHSERALKYILPRAMELHAFGPLQWVLLQRFMAFDFQSWPQDERQAVLEFFESRAKTAAPYKMLHPTLGEAFESLPEIALILASVAR